MSIIGQLKKEPITNTAQQSDSSAAFVSMGSKSHEVMQTDYHSLGTKDKLLLSWYQSWLGKIKNVYRHLTLQEQSFPQE